jgi:hypothetical protein
MGIENSLTQLTLSCTEYFGLFPIRWFTNCVFSVNNEDEKVKAKLLRVFLLPLPINTIRQDANLYIFVYYTIARSPDHSVREV